MICRRMTALVFALCFTVSLVAVTLAGDLNGVWKGQAEFPDGQTRELTYTLKVDGNKLTGTIESPRGKIDISEGKVEGDKFTFNTMRDGNAIAHEGKLADGKIKITVHTAGGDREYSLSPVAAVADQSKPAADSAKGASATSAKDINGQWQGKIKDESGNDIDLVYQFKVDGNKLTGTVEGPAGKLPLEEGSVDGSKLKFQISFGDFHIKHDATLADGKIRITAHMPDKDREYTVSRSPSADSAAKLAGLWETKITTPDGTEIPLKYDLHVDGDKLSGTVESPRGKLDLKEGKVNGDQISYKLTIGDNDVSYEGQLVDGKINLKSHGGPFGDREYKLARPAK